MKRIVVLIFLGTLMVGCKSQKKATQAKKDPRKVTVNRPKKDGPKKDETAVVSTPNTSGSTGLPTSTKAYIEIYKDIAMHEMKTYGIPASITLAQGILESGSGKGRLAVKANNHFGIKCHGWEGEKIYHDDDKAQECFRKYANAKYSFRDHSEFLVNRKRYANLFKLKKSDYRGWAKELRRAGYATDKKYPQKLIALIERYGLDKYDKQVLGAGYKEVPKTTEAVAVSEKHVVKKGDTLYSISRRYNLSVKELQRMNGLKGTDIKIGQVLKIEKN